MGTSKYIVAPGSPIITNLFVVLVSLTRLESCSVKHAAAFFSILRNNYIMAYSMLILTLINLSIFLYRAFCDV